MQVYIEVSKNHNIPIGQVIREKFRPEMRLLIMYYNHQMYTKMHQAEEMEEEQEKIKYETKQI